MFLSMFTNSKRVIRQLIIVGMLVAWIPFASGQQEKYIQAEKKKTNFIKNKQFSSSEGDYNYVTVPNYAEGNNGAYREYEPGGSAIIQSFEQRISDESRAESRKERYGETYGNGVAKKPNPKIVPPKPLEFPEIDIPDIDIDIDKPAENIFTWFEKNWEDIKKLLIALVVIAVFIIIYMFIKNLRPTDKSISMSFDDEWNPKVVTKSKLQLALEKAKLSNNYRECVRVHFLFILKELIEQKSIVWKPEKTNNDYLKEVRNKRGFDNFSECVRIFELVWYGEYEINEQHYAEMETVLVTYYQSLNPRNEH